MALKPITQQQFVVLIDQLTSTYWSKVTSPKESRVQAEYNDGSTGTTRKVAGFTSRENVTLTKAFDPVADKAIIAWYNGLKGSSTGGTGTGATPFAVSITPVTNTYQGTTITGVTITLTGCTVVSLKMPEVDRTGSSAAMLELEVYYEELTLT